MDSLLNNGLINAMRKQLPDGSNLAAVLMDILSLGKEAAYRRLRGEVMFTFEDVAKISRKLGVSLDNIVGEEKISEDNKWAFNLGVLISSYSCKYMEQYDKKIKILLDILCNIENQTKAFIRCATSHVPFFFIVPHKKLTLFRHYKKAYLTNGVNPGFCFSDMKMPVELYEAEKRFERICLEVPKFLLILDRHAFSLLAKDIQYFYQRELLSEDERIHLKESLLNILSDVENVAATGKLSKETEVSIYLSDVSLTSSCAHIESNAFECALQTTYFVDTFNFYNSTICQIQKDWIESLKRYSTLITQTGEKQRMDFFTQQREIIETLI